MIEDIDKRLQIFFVPQLEQLAGSERTVKHGAYADIDAEWGSGFLWAYGIGDDRLITVHEVDLEADHPLVEYRDDYACIASMTAASALYTPIRGRRFAQRNGIAFTDTAGVDRFELKAGEQHYSFTLCLTQRYFENLSLRDPHGLELLLEFFDVMQDRSIPPNITSVLESLDPVWAHRFGGDLFCRGKADEAIALAMAWMQEKRGREHDGSPSEIVLAAKEIVHERFDQQLTLDQMSNALFVGRTTLCTRFKEETGMSLGSYIRQIRMEEAQRLLTSTDADVREISQAVGYSSQASFAAAFQREYGVSPRKWREEGE